MIEGQWPDRFFPSRPPRPSLLLRSTLTLLLPLIQACSHPEKQPSPSYVFNSTAGIEVDAPSDEVSVTQGRNPASTLLARRQLLRSMRGFHDNASAGFMPAIRMIEGASQTIDIEIYEMEDPDFQEAISEAVDRGVHVRIVKDPSPVGRPGACAWFKEPSESDSPECTKTRHILQKIRDRGGAVVPFQKQELCDRDEVAPERRKRNCFQHGKLIITDGMRALISTGNFNSSSLCNQVRKPSKCNRDFSYIITRKAEIERLQKVFDSDLTESRYRIRPLAMPRNSQVTVSPYSLEPLVQFVKSARKSIRIQNQYLKHEPFNDALIAAAGRGVRVEVMLASLCAFSRPPRSAYPKFERLFKRLEDAGIRIRMFTARIRIGGRLGYLHSKAILVDDQKAWLGSVNGSVSGLERNREFGVFFHDAPSIPRLGKILRDDFEHPESQTWQESFACRKDRMSVGKAGVSEEPALTPDSEMVDDTDSDLEGA